MRIEDVETWKPVVGYEGLYEVSDHGRVRSLDREVPTKGLGKRTIKGRILSSAIHHTGYVQYGLSRNGKQRNHLAHSLVLEAFVGPRPPEQEGCHRDSNKTNNRLTNLRWDTKVGNAADKPSNRGSANPNARLDEKQVAYVIERLEAGVPQLELAHRLGIPGPTINHIATGRTWSETTKRRPTRRHTTVTQELANRMARMKHDGMSLNAIAKELGVGSATVFRNYRRGAIC